MQGTPSLVAYLVGAVIAMLTCALIVVVACCCGCFSKQFPRVTREIQVHPPIAGRIGLRRAASFPSARTSTISVSID